MTSEHLRVGFLLGRVGCEPLRAAIFPTFHEAHHQGQIQARLLLFATAVTEVLRYAPRTEVQTADLLTAAPGGLTDLCLAVTEGTARVRTSGATMPRGTVILLTDGRPTVPA